MNNAIKIGSLRATIAGDDRYTDTIKVLVMVDDSVRIEVSSSCPSGGRDSFSDATFDSVKVWEFPKETLAKDILKQVKAICANDNYNFKRYGKPTKNFNWIDATSNHGAYGLNLKNLQNALGLARLKE